MSDCRDCVRCPEDSPRPDIFLVGFGGLLVERPETSDTVAVVSVVGVDCDVEADEEACERVEIGGKNRDNASVLRISNSVNQAS
jgi:hypothetical protein